MNTQSKPVDFKTLIDTLESAAQYSLNSVGEIRGRADLRAAIAAVVEASRQLPAAGGMISTSIDSEVEASTTPTLRFERPDDETLEIHFGSVKLGSFNHDRHGWDGMEVVENLVRAFANALNLPVEDC